MRPSELVVGNCYFNVGYADEDLAVPNIHTLLYVAPERSLEDGQQLWPFREAAYHPRGVPDLPDEARVGFPEDQLHMILDHAGLVRELGESAPQHPLHPLPPQPGPAFEADLGALAT